jgi:hypothetical protein
MGINAIPKPHYVTDDLHSELSPSGAKRWITCPASINFLRNIKKVPQKSSIHAEEGTAAHELAAFCLENEVKPESCIGKVFNKFKVDAEMARQVAKYVDYVEGAVTWDAALWVENRLSLETIEENMFGTADAIIVSEDGIEVVDLKYGKGVVVEVEDNPQLSLYAIGVLVHLAKNGLRFGDDTEVKLTIAQPRAAHADGPIRSTTLTVAQLKDFKEQVKKAIEISKLPTAPFGPGTDQCRWCDGAPTCKAFAEHNLRVAQLEFADMLKTPLEVKQKLPNVEELTEEELSKIMTHSKTIENWLNAVGERAIKLAKSGTEIPRWKLVYGRSNRAWSSESKVVAALEEYGTDLNRLYEKKFLSPSKAEKELTNAEWEHVKDFIFKPTGKITLAPETDGRPAVDANKAAADDWEGEDVE